MINTFLVLFSIYFVNHLTWHYFSSALPNMQPHITFSISDLKPLLKVQKSVIFEFENIISERRKLLNWMQRKLKRFQVEHAKAEEDFRHYSGNPINAFKMIKRVTEDLHNFKRIIQQTAEKEARLLSRMYSLKHSTNVELEAAVRIILRLQRVYLLNITELANGLLKTAYSGDGKIYQEVFLPMTASDCFVISKVMFGNNEYKQGIPWLLESLRLYNSKKPVLGMSMNDIVQSLSRGYKVLNDIAKKDLDEKWKLKSYVSGKCLKKPKVNTEVEIRKIFRKLCRDEIDLSHEITKSLKCWYFRGHRPFSRLAPFRAEQLFTQPDITLIYNALSSNEIYTIKHFALSEETTDIVQYAKAMDLSPDQTQSVKQVIERIRDLTGLLEIDTPIAVANYGVGSQFLCHLDDLTLEADEHNDHDNDTMITVTTVKFYLSEGHQGGATVFPMLALRVFPIEGAAMIWNNFLPSGEADNMLQYGVCPVLRGSRWAATQLIDNSDQLVIKPCTKRITSRLPEDLPPLKFKRNFYIRMKQRNKNASNP